ncbi:helix-turn-helix domain-containing protein, partial [candidate division KSB1 bacterium]|nr:helix-turn-helix domain-containing protein [candidate division KSB1 bacterium]
THGLYSNIITALTVDADGTLWIGTLQGGLARCKENAIRVFDFRDGLTNMDIYSLMTDHTGAVWIGTLQGLYRLNRDQNRIAYISGTSYTPVTALIADTTGALWIGTMADGLLCRRAGRIAHCRKEVELRDDYIRALFKDRKGHLWIGTDSNGLLQLKKAKAASFTRAQGLPEAKVTAVLSDMNESIWLGTRSSGVCKLSEGRITKQLNKKTGLLSNRIQALFQDDSGALWIGSENAGVTILQGGAVKHLTVKSGLPSERITTFLQDRFGALWIGTGRGIALYSGNKLRIIKELQLLQNEYVHALLQSRDGAIFIGCKTGVYRWTGSDCQKINLQDQPSSMEVLALYQDADGILWIGTNGHGLIRLDDGASIAITSQTGLPDNYIFSIHEADDGFLWFSSYNGVFKVRRALLNEFAKKKRRHVPFCWYDESDGMPSRQCNGTGSSAVARGSDGRIYYPTVAGLAIFSDSEKPSSAPQGILEKIEVNASTIKTAPAFTIDRTAVLNISFTAIDFSAPDKLRFYHQLEGEDEDYIYTGPGQMRRARYSNLKPGDYTFYLKVVNNDGAQSEADALATVHVRSGLVGKLAIFTALILLLLTVGGLAIYYYKRKYRPIAIKYGTSTLDRSRIEEIVTKLLHLMEVEKIYLNPDLTLKDLAGPLRIHYNHLSQIIHERFGMNYNDFINKYRVAEAQRRLTDAKESDKSVSEIMYEVGFYSKSVFNTAFKKFTGTTPSRFRKGGV